MLLPNTDAAGCERIAERVRRALRAAAIPHAPNQPSGLVTASIGGAICRLSVERSAGPAVLIEAADRALYAAKAAGRDRLVMAGELLTFRPVVSALTTASGLQIIDTKVGAGASPKPGQICVMHYTGWLYENGQKGKKFDSSVDRNEPFEFPIGQKRVIAGWDEGVASMKVGGKRTLIIPPALGYGARGAGGLIPPNATLMFDVELLGVK